MKTNYYYYMMIHLSKKLFKFDDYSLKQILTIVTKLTFNMADRCHDANCFLAISEQAGLSNSVKKYKFDNAISHVSDVINI